MSKLCDRVRYFWFMESSKWKLDMENKVLLEYKITPEQYFYKIIKLFFFILLMSFFVTLLSDIGIRKKHEVSFYQAFSVLLLIFIIYSFLVNRMTHLLIVNKNSKIYLSITYIKFLFFRKMESDQINYFEFSFKEERTSRIGKNIVFKLYFRSNLIINRSNDLDGFSELQIKEIVLKLREIGLTEI